MIGKSMRTALQSSKFRTAVDQGGCGILLGVDFFSAVVVIDDMTPHVTDVRSWMTSQRIDPTPKLDLSSTKVTDAGLEHLNGLTNSGC